MRCGCSHTATVLRNEGCVLGPALRAPPKENYWWTWCWNELWTASANATGTGRPDWDSQEASRYLKTNNLSLGSEILCGNRLLPCTEEGVCVLHMPVAAMWSKLRVQQAHPSPIHHPWVSHTGVTTLVQCICYNGSLTKNVQMQTLTAGAAKTVGQCNIWSS